MRSYFYPQFDAMDCGPACLRMVAKHYGKHYSLQTLRKRCSMIFLLKLIFKIILLITIFCNGK